MKPDPGAPEPKAGRPPGPWEILCGRRDVTAEVGSTSDWGGCLWLLLAVLRIWRTRRHQASFCSKMQRSYICRTCIWPSLMLKWSNVESEWGAGRELTHSTLNKGHSGNRMFGFEDVSDPGVSYPTSSCCSISRTTHGPGFCVGQIDSSKGLASKFIMVVITHLRMVARGARPSKEIGNSAMKRWWDGLLPWQKEELDSNILPTLEEQISEHGQAREMRCQH